MLSRILQGAALLTLIAVDGAAAVPEQVASNLYRLGTDSDSAFVVTTAEGNILINSGSSEASNAALKPATIRAQMTALGLRFEDIKLLLASHAHADHVGGHALIRRQTGAKVAIMEGDELALRTGMANDYGIPVKIAEPCPVDQVLQHRDQVRLGEVALTAYRTAGHTQGATTWALQSTRAGKTLNVLLLDSTMQYRGREFFAEEYPSRLRDYADGLRGLRELPADIAFDPHGGELQSHADIMQRFESKAAELRREAAEQLQIQLDPALWRAARERAIEQYHHMLTAPETRLAYPELQLNPEKLR